VSGHDLADRLSATHAERGRAEGRPSPGICQQAGRSQSSSGAAFTHHQDLPNAMNAAEITDKLGLHSLRQRAWYIQAACATSGDGLYEGLEWVSHLSASYLNRSDHLALDKPQEARPVNISNYARNAQSSPLLMPACRLFTSFPSFCAMDLVLKPSINPPSRIPILRHFGRTASTATWPEHLEAGRGSCLVFIIHPQPRRGPFSPITPDPCWATDSD
jgi:hypothetical protein